MWELGGGWYPGKGGAEKHLGSMKKDKGLISKEGTKLGGRDTGGEDGGKKGGSPCSG